MPVGRIDKSVVNCCQHTSYDLSLGFDRAILASGGWAHLPILAHRLEFRLQPAFVIVLGLKPELKHLKVGPEH